MDAEITSAVHLPQKSERSLETVDFRKRDEHVRALQTFRRPVSTDGAGQEFAASTRRGPFAVCGKQRLAGGTGGVGRISLNLRPVVFQ